MVFILVCLLELLLLFVVSKSLTRNISYLFHMVTRSKRFTVYILALLFLPGTIIHELAHFFTAKLVFVHAGKIRLFPVLHGEDVIMGSVEIAKTDPFRRFLIGAAPFFTGMSIILCTLYFLLHNNLFENKLFLSLTGYIIFEIGTTMFSSKRDMEGALELSLLIIIPLIIGYFIGVKPPDISEPTAALIAEMFRKGSLFLAIPLGLDLALICLLKLAHKLFR